MMNTACWQIHIWHIAKLFDLGLLPALYRGFANVRGDFYSSPSHFLCILTVLTVFTCFLLYPSSSNSFCIYTLLASTSLYVSYAILDHNFSIYYTSSLSHGFLYFTLLSSITTSIFIVIASVRVSVFSVLASMHSMKTAGNNYKPPYRLHHYTHTHKHWSPTSDLQLPVF